MENKDKYIVLDGNLITGYKAVGPFDEYSDAANWCSRRGVSETSFIRILYSPEDNNI